MPNELSYVWGQCTYYAAKVAGWIPAGLGNAKDWLANAQSKGFATTANPTVGSVVVYGAGGGYNSQFGHVAVVQSVNPANQTFNVSEMDYYGSNIVDTRTSTLQGVSGFILPPGGTPGQPFGSGAGSSNSSGSGGFDPLGIGAALTGAKQNASEFALGFMIVALAVGLILLGVIIIGGRPAAGVAKTAAVAKPHRRKL